MESKTPYVRRKLYSERHKDDGQAVKEATVMPEGRYVHQNLQTCPYGEGKARDSENMGFENAPRHLMPEEIEEMYKEDDAQSLLDPNKMGETKPYSWRDETETLKSSSLYSSDSVWGRTSSSLEERQKMEKEQEYEQRELEETRRRAALEVNMYENRGPWGVKVIDNMGSRVDYQTLTQNQEMKKDLGKPRLALVPPSLIEAVGQILTFGAAKYEPNGWKRVDPDRYKDAMVRHLCAYLEDEFSVDEESGLSHLWHMTCNAAFLIDFQTHTGT